MEQHATLRLVPARRAPRVGRVFAADTLEAWAVPAEDIDAVQLVVSELVTNAVLHASESPTITLELRMTLDGVRVMVSDESSRVPEYPERSAPWSAPVGRGVALVDTLVDRWGTEPQQPRGKTVWCELRTEPARS